MPPEPPVTNMRVALVTVVVYAPVFPGFFRFPTFPPPERNGKDVEVGLSCGCVRWSDCVVGWSRLRWIVGRFCGGWG